MKANHPSLLVAVPHNETLGSDMEALEIGGKTPLRWDKIKPTHMRARENDLPPVLLLLGCNTASAGIGFEDFVAEFRRNGAAVVVGTITTVLGKQAAPVAAEFVRQLCRTDRWKGRRFGEIMREVRSVMLRQGNPMSLALAAFGDIDWLVQ